jgi:hypothetical protein
VNDAVKQGFASFFRRPLRRMYHAFFKALSFSSAGSVIHALFTMDFFEEVTKKFLKPK